MAGGDTTDDENTTDEEYKLVHSRIIAERKHQNGDALDARVKEINHSALVEAVRRGDVATLKRNFRDNAEALGMVYDVASKENLDVLDALLLPEQDEHDGTRIIKAVRYRRVSSLKNLIEAGVKLDSVRNQGHTLFQYAVIHDTVDCLLEALNAPLINNYSVSMPNLTIVNEADGKESIRLSQVLDYGHNVRRFILQKNQEGRNALHTAAMKGDIKSLKMLYSLCGRDVDPDMEDLSGDTPLSLAANAGYADCVKYLVKKGSDLSRVSKSGATAIQLILKYCPRGKEIIEKVLNWSIKEDGKVDFSVLMPKGADTQLEVVYQLFQYARKDQWSLLRHPLVDCLIAIKWYHVKILFLARFVTYFCFTMFVTTYAIVRTMQYEHHIANAFRIPSILFSVLVIIVSLLFVSSTPVHLARRLGTTVLRLLSPVLSLTYVIFDDFQSKWSQQVGSFAILSCWLSLLMNIDIYPKLSHQAYMFLEISYSMFKYMVVFACVILAFSFSFFVLFVDKYNFRNPWRSFLYTSMILLQGSFGNIRLFNEDHVDTSDSIVIGLISLLFLVVTIIGVLNMMVSLAVRGGQEMQEDGLILYQKKKIETLYGLEKFVLSKYMRFCMTPVPKTLNVKYVNYISKKLKIRVMNVNKKKAGVYVDKDNQKLHDKLQEMESSIKSLREMVTRLDHKIDSLFETDV